MSIRSSFLSKLLLSCVIFATCQSGRNLDRVIEIGLLAPYLSSLPRISYFDPSPGPLLLPNNHHKWHTLLLTVLELGQHLWVAFVENLCLWYVRVGEEGEREVKERQGMEGGKEGGRESKGRAKGEWKGGTEINSDVGPMSLMRCPVPRSTKLYLDICVPELCTDSHPLLQQVLLS